MKADSFTIEIMEDGTIKVVTDKFSPTNHASAEAVLRMIKEAMGSEEIERTGHTHAHTHLGRHEEA